MATTRLYLDMRGKASDGKGSVVILLYHNATQTSISTGVRMSRSEWKEDNPSLVLLQEKKNEIDKAIAILSFEDGFDMMTAVEIKEAVVKKKQPRQVSHPLSDIFEDYLATTKLKPKTKELYKYTLKRVEQFSPCVNIESINLKWLKRFDTFMSGNQGINGKAVYLRCLRTILNHARDNDIQCQYPFSKFSIKYEETRKRCIELGKLREFYKFPVTDTKYSMYRDYFFLMFFLIGINSKDLLLAKKSQIQNGRLEYIREKTGKKYSIRIEPEAQELIDRYSGKGDYILDAMDHCKHYDSFTREINEGLRMIGYVNEDKNDIRTVTPLIPGITTYYARHTWATLAYEAGVPVDVISQALGHSMGNKTTLIYIKPDQDKVDKANRLVIDRFFTLS